MFGAKVRLYAYFGGKAIRVEEPAVKHKQCPRCGQTFACQPEDITHCQCYGIVLSPEALQHISSHYHDCLCRNCLTEIGLMFSVEKGMKE